MIEETIYASSLQKRQKETQNLKNGSNQNQKSTQDRWMKDTVKKTRTDCAPCTD